MPKTFENLYVNLDDDLRDVVERLCPRAAGYHILRQSVDARRRQERPRLVYSLQVFCEGEEIQPRTIEPLKKRSWKGPPPIIIGAGPAGLFCAIRFLEQGIPCRLFERGSTAEKRILKINRYWRYGELDDNNNVCFGEGGAGLYSDGKLITRIKSPHISYVLHKLVQFGAPEEILYLANPHVGSDRIRRLIPKIRQFLLSQACELYFDAQVEELLTRGNQVRGIKLKDGRQFHAEHVVLATGHSASDLIYKLHEQEVTMEGKSFAVGFRIEHPQSLINQIQYRQWQDHPKLPTAIYRLAEHDSKTGLGVYSFCMCPGGYVVSSSTEKHTVVSNGMSNYHRNSPYANAAIVVTIDHNKRFGQDNPFAGLQFRHELERRAFDLVQNFNGQHQLPGQKVEDFFAGRGSNSLLPSSCPSGAVSTPLHTLLPEDLQKQLKLSLTQFEKKMPGFCGEQAQLFGVESRTSCPVRISRNPTTLQSISHAGLYPCGEGAGYAGGITSAAVDGVRIADSICQE